LGSLEQSVCRHLVDYLDCKESYDDFADWMYGNGDLLLDAFQATLRELGQPVAVSAE
jgi:hypothetical protein